MSKWEPSPEAKKQWIDEQIEQIMAQGYQMEIQLKVAEKKGDQPAVDHFTEQLHNMELALEVFEEELDKDK